jgi:FkbM family methyltransferase
VSGAAVDVAAFGPTEAKEDWTLTIYSRKLVRLQHETSRMDLEGYLAEPLPFRQELEQLLRDVRKPMIFDIGSCEGEDSIRLTRAFPRATIHSFEPVPRNVEMIRANFARYAPQLNAPHACALGDVDGTAVLHLSSGHPDGVPEEANWDYGNKSSSLFAPSSLMSLHYPWLHFESKLTVRVERIDTFCQRHGISSVDFLYIDVQGAELQVLKGAGHLLRSLRAAWLEVEAIELYAGQPLASDVDLFMEANGFEKVVDTVDAVSGDRLYIRT